MTRASFFALPASLFVVIASIALCAPPELPDGTDVATNRIPAFKVPVGMKVELFAAEPKLASPVAIGLDERNRVFVAEEYRFNLGTEENRTRPFLLDDDLQIETLDDRLKMFEKFASKFDGGMEWFRKTADQVRLVEDTDGDGKADRATVFAPDFNGTLDGLAAGVMATDGDIYFTCIPNLWRLRDTNNDGVADERTIIHTGFGVNAGFLGHDLHGLCWGPDGKLYFSVGDRGFHLQTHEGRTLHGPRNGAVFRCYPDGSELEVVMRGLRNPQEIAFDQFGNLFAADNNCDKGDHSRMVFVIEGADAGWNMAHQSIPDPYLTGTWHAEKMWHLWESRERSDERREPEKREGNAAASGSRLSSLDSQAPQWILPPVGKLGAGPSGFAYYPGTGLPARYDHHFFLCNYTGNGGIESFGLKPRGAGFETTDEHDFMKPISATDCEFGYDGKLYVSDFVNLLWNGGSVGGRVYTLFDTQLVNDSAVKETTELFRNGFKQLVPEKLTKLLSHPDMRVRQRAQFALAARGVDSVPLFQTTLATSKNRFARLHALWGLGQVATRRDSDSRRAATVVPSPPSSGERARVRGPKGESASQLATDATLSPSPRRGGPGRGDDLLAGVQPQAAPLPSPPRRGEGTKPKAEDGRTPHPNPLPAKARGEGTRAIAAHLEDTDIEVRAHAARLVGDLRHLPAAEPLVKRLTDESLRVRLFAAISLGKLKHQAALPAVITMLRDNNDADPWLRHAGVMALVGMEDRAALLVYAKDTSPAVRLAVLLALRHLVSEPQRSWPTDSAPLAPALRGEGPGVRGSSASTQPVVTRPPFTPIRPFQPNPDDVTPFVQLLQDDQWPLVAEAARAINDLPLEAGFPALASLALKPDATPSGSVPEALVRRVINANFRLGGAEHARRVVSFIVDPRWSLAIRREALASLIDWDAPSPRDRVNGFWRPVPPRDEATLTAFKSLLADHVATLLAGTPPELQTDLVKLIDKQKLPTDDAVFAGWVTDGSKTVVTRGAALRLLATRKAKQLDDSLVAALKSDLAPLRADARDLIATLRPADAIPLLGETLANDDASTLERQRAVLTLATLRSDGADAILRAWVAKLTADHIPEPLQLDVLEAATIRDLPDLKLATDQFKAKLQAGEPLARYRPSLQGGDSERGREVFTTHRVGQCVRCHSITDPSTKTVLQSGGNAGPNLFEAAKRHDRTALLQSLVDPSAKIAKGYETVTLVLNDGRTFGGIIKQEDANQVILEQPDGKLVTLKPNDIDERTSPKSAMPEMNRALSPRELRDLVEFLTTLK